MSTLTADNALEFTRVQSRLRSYTGSALTRLRLQAALDSAAIALTVSAWLLVLLVLADKLFSLSNLGVNVWVVWGGVSLLGIPFVIWRTFAPSLHERRAAILADDRLGLHARLSSALTLDFNDPANAHFSEAFLSEAMGKMAAIRVQHAFPIRIPRALAWLLLPAAFATGIFYGMQPQDLLGIVTKAEAKRKAEERKMAAADNLKGTLEDLKKKIDEKAGDEKSGNFKVNQAIKDAENVAKDLKDGKRDAEEALLKLGSLKKELEDEKEKIQRGKEFSERIEKLQAKDLNLDDTDHTKAVSEALKLGDVGVAAKEMRKAAQKIKDEVLNNDKLSAEEKQKKLEQLKKEMEKLAGALAEDEALRDKLQELAQSSMSAADYQKLSEEMKKADERQNKGNKKFGDDIERQMEDAADQMERLEEENDVKLNEEEQKEVDDIEKLEEGLDQAMEGLAGENKGEGDGKEAQHKGGGKTGGDKPGKQGQGQNGKGKMRSMNGKSGRQGGKDSGGQGKKQGGGDKGDENKGQNPNGKPGDGLGGGPGQGSRPYTDGEAQFKSEKVQGELRAGAITGISHFRGQGAKGNAPEEFYKTFEPESKDGASSLELERVPAEAREMVKDYFTRVRDGANEAKTPAPAPANSTPAPAPAPAPVPKKADSPSKEGLKE